METQRQTHPTARQLAAFGLGKLTPDSQRRMQEHLAGCKSCAAFLSNTPLETLGTMLQQSAANVSLGDQSTPGVRDSSTLGGLPSAANQVGSAGPIGQRSARQASRPATVGPPAAERPLSALADDIPQPLREQTKYRVIRLLGRGGMGSVYEAYHERMGRKVALKIIASPMLKHPDALKRFEQEVRAAANLDHPNLARAYDADVFGNLHVLVMEYVSGRSLDKLLAECGPMSVQQACHCALHAAQGLQHAHQRGMVHRDLKPANLMLTSEGCVKILDFGLAKLSPDQQFGSGLTRDHALMGTPAYLAPEQALDAAKADIRADIYSLGCTLYALLTGAAPFVGDTEMKVLLAHQHDPHRPLVEVRPDVPRELSDLVDRMLAKKPADRPQTPAEVAAALLPFAKRTAAAVRSTETQAVAAVSSALETIEVPMGSDLLSGRTASIAKPLVHANIGALARYWAHLPPTRRWATLAMLAFLPILLGGWATTVFLRTPTGSIVVKDVPADAEVLVDGQALTLTRNGDSVTIEAVQRGGHTLQLTRDGERIWAQDITIEFGGQQVTAKYVPSLASGLPSAPEVDPQLNTAASTNAATQRVSAIPNVAHAVPADRELRQAQVLRGKWEVDGDDLVQLAPLRGGETCIVFGSPQWSSYDLSLKAKATEGKCCLRVFFNVDATRRPDGPAGPSDRRMIEFGCLDNTQHRFLPKFDYKDVDEQARIVAGHIALGAWYDIKIEVRGIAFRCLLDGSEILKGSSPRNSQGRIGLGGVGTVARFSDITVTSPDGHDLLWNGNPIPPSDSVVLLADAAEGQAAKPIANERFSQATVKSGAWAADGEELVQNSTKGETCLLFGDPGWSRYDFMFKAKAEPGGEGFLAFFQADDNGSYWKAAVDGVGNGYEIQAVINGKRGVHWHHTHRLERDKWHDVRIEVRGVQHRYVLDGQTLFVHSHQKLTSGLVGLGSAGTVVRFRDIIVMSEDKKQILWQGLPKLMP